MTGQRQTRGQEGKGRKAHAVLLVLVRLRQPRTAAKPPHHFPLSVLSFQEVHVFCLFFLKKEEVHVILSFLGSCERRTCACALDEMMRSEIALCGACISQSNPNPVLYIHNIRLDHRLGAVQQIFIEKCLQKSNNKTRVHHPRRKLTRRAMPNSLQITNKY